MWIKKTSEQYINTELLVCLKVEGAMVVGFNCNGNKYPIAKASDSEEAQTILDGIYNKIHQGKRTVDILEIIHKWEEW